MSTADEADTVRAIAAAIHRYVIAHPDAADTIDGIYRWWLLPTLQEASRMSVAKAVEQLVADGMLRLMSMEDGRVIYACAQHRHSTRS